MNILHVRPLVGRSYIISKNGLEVTVLSGNLFILLQKGTQVLMRIYFHTEGEVREKVYYRDVPHIKIMTGRGKR